MAVNMTLANDTELCANLYKLFDTTELTIQSIADTLSIGYSTAAYIIKKHYPIDQRKARSAICYANSKAGSSNPMYGNHGDKHHRYKGVVSDGRGYLMTLKPAWYTGRAGSKHVFLHSVVMCEALGLTEIPKGFSVHHIDKNPLNNELRNLALVSLSAHSHIHSRERATTIPKGSTAKRLEAQGTLRKRQGDDIVCSLQ